MIELSSTISGPLRSQGTPASGVGRYGRSACVGFIGAVLIAVAAALPGAPFAFKVPGAWFFGVPPFDYLGGIAHASGSELLLELVGGFAGIVLLCRAWLTITRNVAQEPETRPGRLAAILALWATPLLIAPPMFSNDIYSYAAQGEMVSRHINPYLYGPGVLGATPFESLARGVWINTPSPYGPLSSGLDGGLVQLAGHRALFSVLLLRLVAVVGVVLMAVFVPSLARSYGRDPGLAFSLGVLNPLVLLFLIGSGHNDALMIGLLVCGLSIARRGHPLSGIAMCALAGALKVPGLIGVLAIAWTSVGELSSPWRRILGLAKASVLAAAILELLSVSFGLGWGWIRALGSADAVTSWITPVDLVAKLVPHVGISAPAFLTVAHIVGPAIAIAIGLWALRHLAAIGLPSALGLTLLGFVLLGPIVQPWYLVWAMAILAITAGPRTVSGIAFLSVVVSVVGVVGLGQLSGELGSLGLLSPLLFLLVLAATILLPIRMTCGNDRSLSVAGTLGRRWSSLSVQLHGYRAAVTRRAREGAWHRRAMPDRNAISHSKQSDLRPLDVCRSTGDNQLRHNYLAIAGIAAAVVCVLGLQTFLHGHFLAVDEYDDGVYFGASVELFHGVMPYRDFAFIQPPTITLWMLPFSALSSLTGTAIAMESARLFVDFVTVTNVVLVGALVRRRSTLQVMVATGVMAFSQGTIRSSQTILLEPFLVLACLVALHCLMDGESITSSSRRLWWCGICFGIAGATKLWAVLPFVAVLIVLSSRGARGQGKVVGGAIVGFLACSVPFIVGSPAGFFQQVFVTQAVRSAGGLALLGRLADLTGIPGFASLIEGHRMLGVVLLALVLLVALGLVVLGWTVRDRQPSSPLERFAMWGTAFVGIGLCAAPTYYYHYSGFMAPFVALAASFSVVRSRTALSETSSVRSLTFPTAWRCAVVPVAIVALMGDVIINVADLPVAPPVGDAVSDAIPGHGCVLYANPAVALLDNRFTSDVSGCPTVIDWLGQERVLTNGSAAAPSDAGNGRLQSVMNRWITSSDAVVLGRSNFGLNDANVDYLHRHFTLEMNGPRGLRIYVRALRHPHKVAGNLTDAEPAGIRGNSVSVGTGSHRRHASP